MVLAASAVSTITGMRPLSSARRRRARMALKPSIRGMRRSIRIRS